MHQDKGFGSDQYDDLFEQFIESSPLRYDDSCTGILAWEDDNFFNTSAAATEIPVKGE